MNGLIEGLRAACHDPILLLAVDMPEMTTDYLMGLISRTEEGRGIVPELDGFYQGLCAVYPRRILPLVEGVMRGGDHSFQHLIRLAVGGDLLRVIPVSEAERPLFANWNTPDLARTNG